MHLSIVFKHSVFCLLASDYLFCLFAFAFLLLLFAVACCLLMLLSVFACLRFVFGRLLVMFVLHVASAFCFWLSFFSHDVSGL